MGVHVTRLCIAIKVNFDAIGFVKFTAYIEPNASNHMVSVIWQLLTSRRLIFPDFFKIPVYRKTVYEFRHFVVYLLFKLNFID